MFQKVLFLLFGSMFNLLNLSQHQFNFLHQNINQKHSTCTRVLNYKFLVFLPCVSILIVLIFQRKHFNFKNSRCSNGYFIKTTGFFSLIRVGITKLPVVENVLMGKLSILFLHQCFDSPKFPRRATFFSSLNFTICFPQPLQVRFPPL